MQKMKIQIQHRNKQTKN